MELDKLVKKLNEIGEIIKNKDYEKILTNLFDINDNRVSIHNLFYQIEFDGRHISEWITSGLSSIKEFSNYNINNRGSDQIGLEIRQPKTSYESNFQYECGMKDTLAKIDLINRKYDLTGYRKIKELEDILAEPIEKYEDIELEEFWLDLIKHRNMKISDRLFYFNKCMKKREGFISSIKMAMFNKKKINEKLEVKLEGIKHKNERGLKYYEERLKRQSENKIVYPVYIKQIKKELSNIKTYMDSIGYEELREGDIDGKQSI